MKKTIYFSLITIAFAFVFNACNQSAKNKEMVKKESWEMHQGKEVFLFTLTNKDGNVLKLSNYGARITWIEVPDRSGKKENVS